jgi:hypothetical protein
MFESTFSSKIYSVGRKGPFFGLTSVFRGGGVCIPKKTGVYVKNFFCSNNDACLRDVYSLKVKIAVKAKKFNHFFFCIRLAEILHGYIFLFPQLKWEHLGCTQQLVITILFIY